MSENGKSQTAGNQPKLTARERIGQILDVGSFVEIDKYVERSNAVYGYPDVTAPGEGVIAGWGTMDTRPVYLVAEDYEVLKGSMGTAHAAKINKTIDMAAKTGLPVIFVWDSAGARVQEGPAAIHAYASVMKKIVDVSGVIPTISIAAGGMYGAAAMLAPLTDFTIAIDGVSALSIASPMVLAATEGKDVDAQALCGGKVMSEKSGTAQFLCASEAEAVETLRQLLSYLPSNNLEEAPFELCEDDVSRAVAADGSDALALIREIADHGEFLEVSGQFAENMITGFCMINGVSIAVVANAPGKTITPVSCLKAARFIRIADAYEIPVVSLINNEGTDVSLDLAQGCQARALAKLAYAYAEAGTPMISVITGKAVGEGYAAMGTKATGADLVYAFPTAQISSLPAEAGAIILFDGKKSAAGEYVEKFASAMVAAQQGLVDDVIEPAAIRRTLAAALLMVTNKREQKLPKKHGIMPL